MSCFRSRSSRICSRRGRVAPSLPVDLVGSVLVLKELFDLSDAQSAEALRFDIRWKVNLVSLPGCGGRLTKLTVPRVRPRVACCIADVVGLCWVGSLTS
jgi:hypothetical protein